MKRKWLAFWICVGLVWLSAAAIALYHADELSETPSGNAIGLVLLLPPAFVAYLVVHAIGEAVVLAVLLVTFKVVTLNTIETEYTNSDVVFPWYGFARNKHGVFVASENAVALTAVAAYVVAGGGALYFWLR
jgi:succinate-acetate transporter protein